jgi:hypothetical protein
MTEMDQTDSSTQAISNKLGLKPFADFSTGNFILSQILQGWPRCRGFQVLERTRKEKIHGTQLCQYVLIY